MLVIPNTLSAVLRLDHKQDREQLQARLGKLLYLFKQLACFLVICKYESLVQLPSCPESVVTESNRGHVSFFKDNFSLSGSKLPFDQCEIVTGFAAAAQIRFPAFPIAVPFYR